MSSHLHQFLRTRRSIRRFRNDPIPTSIVERILETATYAPSAHDKQPWRFVVVASPEARASLIRAVTEKLCHDMANAAAPEQEIQARVDRTTNRTKEAPVIVLLCRDRTCVHPQPDKVTEQAEITMGRQSVAAAGLQLLLAAHAEGLGGTWICWPLFAPAEISAALALNPDWEPQGMVFIGVPNETPATPARRPVREIVEYL